ncbi:YhdP family protein [Marinomonas ostreistagni]|uniref:YhdP family protein n=1 Tax=Marinomonas ostreistagni TaxID=359209 RepID=UPI001950153E|nr:YhdP family protein [Marinomonas ostreistagni]MBM6549846.1 TIGR02099 family protein [Marinomonas ostreistagni]
MRVLKGVLDLALWVAVAISVLLVSTVLISKLGLPLVAEYRPQIERNLSQLTGMEVTVGAVRAELNGVNVELQAEDMAVTTANQVDAVQIGRLDFELDLVASVLSLSLQFKDVVVSDVNVLLAEDGNGQVALKGMSTRPNRSSDGDTAMSRVLNYLSDQQQFLLTNVSVALESPRFETVNLFIPATYLIKQREQTMLRTDVFINEMAQPVQIRSRINNDLTSFFEQKLTAYVQVPELEVPLDWTSGPLLEPLAGLTIAGEYWLTYQPGKGFTAQGQRSELSAQFNDQKTVRMVGDWRVKHNNDNGTVFALSNLQLESDEQSIAPVNIKGEWEQRSGRGFFVLDRMNAAIASQVALEFVPSDWYLARLLTSLNAQGEARNASLRLWRRDGELRYQYLSNMVNAQVDGFNGIPAVSDVQGVFAINNTQGSIEFATDQTQVMFPTVYEEAWSIDHASGEVSWRQLGDRAFVVEGEQLKVERNGATVQGQFRLENTLTNGVGESWLGLDLNAQHVSTADKFTFVPPNALPESLQTWLDKAIGQGEASNIDLLLRTGLSSGAQPVVRLGIDAEVDRFNFDDAWPNGEQVKAKVLLDGEGVSVDVASAQFAGLPLKNVAVNVPLNNNQAEWVNVKTDFANESSKIMNALRQTPLTESVLSPFVDWRLGGKVSGAVDLSVPIAGQDAEPKVGLNVKFANNSVYIAPLSLEGTVRQGQLNYQPKTGLQGSQFTLAALGGESQLDLRSSTADDGRLVVEGDINGALDSQQLLAWRQWPEILSDNVSGRLVYQARMAINRSQAGQVDVDINSGLKGVTSRFPEPLNKAAEDAQRVNLKFKAINNELLIDVSAQQLAYAKLLFEDGAIEGGNVSLFEPLKANNEMQQGIAIRGQFAEFDWHDWAPVFRSDSAEEQPAAPPTVLTTELPSWMRSANFLVDRLPINDSNQLSNVKLQYNRTQDGHPLTLTSDELNAILRTTAAGEPELHIAYLNWKTDQSGESTDAKGEGIQPAIIPSMKLRVDEVYVDDRPYGDWRADLINLGTNLRIDNITTALPNGNFDGEIFWQGGSNPNVVMTVKATGEQAQQLTRKFSSVPFISSNRYEMDVALSWHDSLLAFSRETLDGRIRFSMQDGNFNQIDKIPPFLRVLGIFNVDSLAKRLTFDFSDLYESGMPFDRFSSQLEIVDGILKTKQPVRVVSPTAEVTIEGTANLIEETLDERLTATVPITSSLPVAGLLLATPQIAGLLYITDKLIGDQISKVTSIQYKITGPFRDPQVKPIRPGSRN